MTWEALKQDRDELIRTLTELCNLAVEGVDTAGCFAAESSGVLGSSAAPGSSEAAPVEPSLVCPEPGGCLLIENSDTPYFPAGSLLEEIIDMGAPGWPCVRSFSLLSPIAGSLVISLSKITHMARFTVEDAPYTATDDVGMSDDYKMALHYRFSENGEEHTIWIGGIAPCPSSSS